MLTIGGLVGLALSHAWLPTSPPTFVLLTGGCALLAASHRVPLAGVALTVASFGFSAAAGAAAAAVVVAVLVAGVRRGPNVHS